MDHQIPLSCLGAKEYWDHRVRHNDAGIILDYQIPLLCPGAKDYLDGRVRHYAPGQYSRLPDPSGMPRGTNVGV